MAVHRNHCHGPDESLEVPPTGNIQDNVDETTPLIVRPKTAAAKAREPGLSLLASLMRQWLPLLLVVWRYVTIQPVICYGKAVWICYWFSGLAVSSGLRPPGVHLPSPTAVGGIYLYYYLLLSTTTHWLCCSLTVGGCRWLILYIDTQESGNPEPLWKGLLYCIVILLAFLCSAILGNIMWWMRTKVDVRIKTALMSNIYKKVWWDNSRMIAVTYFVIGWYVCRLWKWVEKRSRSLLLVRSLTWCLSTQLVLWTWWREYSQPGIPLQMLTAAVVIWFILSHTESCTCLSRPRQRLWSVSTCCTSC